MIIPDAGKTKVVNGQRKGFDDGVLNVDIAFPGLTPVWKKNCHT